MKILFLIIVSVLVSVSCNNDNDIGCSDNFTLVAPSPYQIEKIGAIWENAEISNLHFIDENIGFATGYDEEGKRSVLKTVDGGANWEAKVMDGSYSPINLVFINENIGFLSYHSSNIALLKTEDSGETWQEVIYDGLNGPIWEMAKGPNDNLYGVITPPSQPTKVLMSQNQGQSWDIINNLTLSYVSSMIIHKNRIYVFEIGTTCKVMDLMGNHIKEINLDIADYGVFVIDTNSIIVTDQKITQKTIDGGLNWTQIHDKESKIIHFVDRDNGIMLHQDEFCDIFDIHAISSTSNGGTSWTKSEGIRDIDKYDLEVAVISDYIYILYADNTFYKLQK